VEFLDEVIGADVGQGFPTVMHFGKTLPLDQVLELVVHSPSTQDVFDFPFWLAINKVGDGFLISISI
jgi:hypothetical protein